MNTNVQGSPLVLGTTEYANGLGVAAGSSLTISTNGAYSTFTATIGIDSLVGVGGAVTFEIVGRQ